MKIEIFIVKTEIEKLEQSERENALLWLNSRKETLINLFSGLTVVPDCLGYWVNEKREIETDKVEIWLIYTDKALNSGFYFATLTHLLKSIKRITKQQSQAYAINEKMLFV